MARRPGPRLAGPGMLAFFLCLAAAYGLRIGAGDAPDERAHAEYVLHLRSRGRPPAYRFPQDPHSYEAIQPPLYYAVLAAATKPFEALPARTQLGLMRLLSTLMHLAALALLWRMAVRLDGEAGALGPLAAAAGLPMFAFIGATVTNDAAANLAAAALLWLAARPGAGTGGRTVDAWLAGGLAGLGLLCKATVLPMAGVAAFAACRGAGWAGRLGRAALAAAAVCGWFLVYNAARFGDPFGLSVSQTLVDPDRYAWSELGGWLVLYFQSFWGRFGQMTRPMPAAVYAALALVSAAAAAGWLARGRQLAARPGRRLLWAALGLALAQNFVFGFFLGAQPQARYSFVALAAWAVLFSDGLGAWAAGWSPARRRLAAGALAGLALWVHAEAWLALGA